MARLKAITCCLVALFIFLALLDLATFGIMIGVGEYEGKDVYYTSLVVNTSLFCASFMTKVLHYFMIFFPFRLPAARGIDEANNDNSCRVENSTVDCVLQIDLTSSLGSGTSPRQPRGEVRGANDVYLYWMAGATGCGVIWAVVNTFALIALSELIRAIYIVEEKKHSGAAAKG